MALLEPRLGVLDETDSGLDIDALRIVAEGVNALREPERVLPRHHPLPAPARLHQARRRACDGQGPHREVGRAGTGAGAGAQRLPRLCGARRRERRDPALRHRQDRAETTLAEQFAAAHGAAPDARDAAFAPLRGGAACRRGASKPGITPTCAPRWRAPRRSPSARRCGDRGRAPSLASATRAGGTRLVLSTAVSSRRCPMRRRRASRRPLPRRSACVSREGRPDAGAQRRAALERLRARRSRRAARRAAVEIVHRWPPTAPTRSFASSRSRFGAGARASVIERVVGAGPAPSAIVSTWIVLGAGRRGDACRLRSRTARGLHVESQRRASGRSAPISRLRACRRRRAGPRARFSLRSPARAREHRARRPRACSTGARHADTTLDVDHAAPQRREPRILPTHRRRRGDRRVPGQGHRRAAARRRPTAR